VLYPARRALVIGPGLLLCERDRKAGRIPGRGSSRALGISFAVPRREEAAVERWRERFDLMQRYGFEANWLSGRLVLMTVLAAVSVTLASYLRTPEYEASSKLWASWKQGEYWQNASGSGEQLQTLESRQIAPTLVYAIDSRPIAEETIHRLKLEMTPAELLYRLDVEQVESTSFIVLTYQGNNPVEATKIVNAAAKAVVEIASHRRSDVKAVVWKEAEASATPVRSSRPLFSGLLVLIAGLALSSAPIAPARAAAARAVGDLGERVHAGVQEAAQAKVLRRQRRDRSIVERVNEKKLLLALRHGPLTALDAAFVSGVSVEEADRILSELAHQGQLEFDIENGARVYSFWRHDAPLGPRREE